MDYRADATEKHLLDFSGMRAVANKSLNILAGQPADGN
jgi:hypothetical protein